MMEFEHLIALSTTDILKENGYFESTWTTVSATKLVSSLWPFLFFLAICHLEFKVVVFGCTFALRLQ